MRYCYFSNGNKVAGSCFLKLTRKSIFHMKVNDTQVGTALCGANTDKMAFTTKGYEAPTRWAMCKRCTGISRHLDEGVTVSVSGLGQCRASRGDEECFWEKCPQRDPLTKQISCPLPNDDEDI